MEKKYVGLSVFIVICLSVSYWCHRKIRNFLLSCIIIGVATSIIYQILGTVVVGHLDPFVFISLPVGAGVAFAIAVIAGIPFAYLRLKRERAESGLDAGQEEEDD